MTKPNKIASVPLGKMHIIGGEAQRPIKPARVEHLVNHFDLDDFGVPVVNLRDSRYYIIDGQHRWEALKRWLGDGWERQKIDCRVFDGLTEREEADMFDRLNDVLSVSTFDRFRNRVIAQRPEELDIYKIVMSENLKISRDKVPGAVQAVGTLKRIYLRADGETLRRTLRIIRDAYGDTGFEARVIDGIGHLCQRYNGVLDEDLAVTRLAGAHGGVKGLLGLSEQIHLQTGNAKGLCVAAAAVDVINSKRGGKKLKGWWKS